MKRSATALLIAAAALFASSGAGFAQGGARYCLQGSTYGYPGNCQFSSYRQCMATASGTYETCNINPYYAFARDRRRGRY